MWRKSWRARWLTLLMFVGIALSPAAVAPILAQDVPAAQCGSQIMRIAAMQWPSSKILAHIHGEILSQEFGCATEVINGDLAASLSSMATTGQPALLPELWVTRVASIWNSVIETRKVRAMAPSYQVGALEGWFVPQHMLEKYPNLQSLDGFKSAAESLAAEGNRLKFVSCPADWACALINRHLLEALDLDDLLDIAVPGNRFEMDALVAQAMSSKGDIAFYYWQPNALLAQFAIAPIALPPFHEDSFLCLATRTCLSPQPSGFPSESISMVAADWVLALNDAVSAYLLKASLPMGEMNVLLRWQAETGATDEETAAHFVNSRESVWRLWLN